MDIEAILKYFPSLTVEQKKQYGMLQELYGDWNAKINVISRKDIDYLYEHHVLHSLSIAKLVGFIDQTRVLDLGTGGGFPGIPLAIMFPKCSFTLIDGTGKKVRVAEEIAHSIGLKNVATKHVRGEEEKGVYDFVVSRAAMSLPDLFKIAKKNISKEQRNVLPNGIICLKGGNLDTETKPFRRIVETCPVSN